MVMSRVLSTAVMVYFAMSSILWVYALSSMLREAALSYSVECATATVENAISEVCFSYDQVEVFIPASISVRISNREVVLAGGGRRVIFTIPPGINASLVRRGSFFKLTFRRCEHG